MTIEIHNPELESILQNRVRAGNFASVEQLLWETFKDEPEVSDELTRAKAMDAASRIRDLRKGVSLDRPEGLSLREYAHIGHRY